MADQQSSFMGLDHQEASIFALVMVVMFIVMLDTFIPGFYASIWMAIKIVEINFILLFKSVLPNHYWQHLEVVLYKIHKIDSVSVTWAGAERVDRSIQSSLGWIYNAILIVFGLKVYLRKSHKTKHTLESLLAQETKLWRFNRHLLKYNPAKEGLDITSGMAAIRKRPHVFALENGLLDVIDEDDPKLGYKFNKAKAKEVFEKQYGPAFNGYENLGKEERRLIACFLLFSNEEESKAFEILGDASCALAGEFSFYIDPKQVFTAKGISKKLGGFLSLLLKPFIYVALPFLNVMAYLKAIVEYLPRKIMHLTGNSDVCFYYADLKTDAAIKKYEKSEVSLKAIKQHYYTYGVMRSLLAQAHNYGVLASARFTWFKLHNRTLWYMLSDEGLFETSVECGYPRTHYEIECQLGVKQAMPMGERYINTIKELLTEKGLLLQEVKANN